MKIKILKLGHSASEVDVSYGSSVQEALAGHAQLLLGRSVPVCFKMEIS